MSPRREDRRAPPLRILYLGLPLGALYLHHAGFELVACAISRPDAPGMRRLARRLPGVPILPRPDLDDAAVRAAIIATLPELIVSWFWTRKVPRALLDLTPLGGVNVHPSLLPRHRGADPYFWTLRDRDRETGVTVHRVEDEYDTGAILLQRKLFIPDEVDAWRLAKRLDLPSLRALGEVLTRIRDGDPPDEIPQDSSRATHAPSPSDDDCEIRWSESADEVLALIRAAAPEPGAYSEAGGEVVVILSAERAPKPLATLEPGEVVLVNGGVVITCGDAAAIKVLRARGDDDDRIRSGAAVADLFPDAAELSS